VRYTMKIQLLIAAAERDYSEYLSNTLSAKYADTFVVGLCSSREKLNDVLSAKKYDIILVEPEWISTMNKKNVKLIIALTNEQSSLLETLQDVVKVQKYQRISALVSDILEHFADVASGFIDVNKERGQIVAVWSPTGGIGKTSVALAFATRSVSSGSTVTYLDLEYFSSSDAYFTQEGKSISVLFEKLSSNAELLVKGIRQHDSGSGIYYFSPPNNYDDINELTKEDIVALTNNCARVSDVTVVDLPSICDKRVQAVFELADVILLVSDDSKTAVSKLNIFISQHGVYEDIRDKTRLVLNRGSKLDNTCFDKIINLPRVQAGDPVSVFKTLSGNSFDEWGIIKKVH